MQALSSPSQAHMLSRIPLPVIGGAGYGQTEADFSPDGRHLYLCTTHEVRDLAWFAAAYGPHFAAVIWLIVLAWLLWKTRRVFARPQEPGKAHCPACGYKFVPPTVTRDDRERFVAAPGTICPECGLNVREHPPVEGEARGSRLWLAWGIGGVTSLACFVFLSSTLVWSTVGGWAGVAYVTWPVQGIERWASNWPIRRQVSFQDTKQRMTVAQHNSETGDLVRTFTQSLQPRGEVQASADRRWMSIAETDDSYTSWITLIDTSTGEVRRDKLSSTRTAPPSVTGEVLGFSPDGRSLFVQVNETVVGPTGYVTLWRYDCNTMERTQVHRADIPMVSSAWGLSWPDVHYRVGFDPPGSLRWMLAVMQTDRKLNAAGESELTWFDGQAVRQTTIDPPVGLNWAWYAFIENAATIELLMSSASLRIVVDVASGEQTLLAAPARLTTGVDGRFTAQVRPDGTVRVVDTIDPLGSWSFTPAGPGDYPIAISQDGERVVIMATASARLELQVWERPAAAE